MAINIELKDSLESRLHNGTRIQDAMDIFTAIIDHNGMSNFTIKDWGEEIMLNYLTVPEGWLSRWMIRSDELSIVLFGSRMWDVAYVADKSSVEGFIPVPLSEIAEDTEYLDTYKVFSLAEDEGIPFSARYLVAQQAFFETININGTEVEIKPIRGLYKTKGSLELNQLLPMLDLPRSYGQQLNIMICHINKEVMPELNLNNETSPA